MTPEGLRARREQWNAKKPSKAWVFFNSALGLWVLSSVVISIGSWAFSRWLEDRAEAVQKEKTIRRLDDEIRFRLEMNGSPSGLPIIVTPSTGPATQNHVLAFADAALGPPPPGRDLYPEYSKRSLISLLAELEPLLPKQEAQCVSLARAKVASLKLFLGIDKTASFATAAAKITAIGDYRWSVDAKAADRQRERSNQQSSPGSAECGTANKTREITTIEFPR